MKSVGVIGWTRADQAELELLVDELVSVAWPHRGKPRFDSALAEAVEAVLDWRRARILRSRACRLRALQDILDAKAAA